MRPCACEGTEPKEQVHDEELTHRLKDSDVIGVTRYSGRGNFLAHARGSKGLAPVRKTPFSRAFLHFVFRSYSHSLFKMDPPGWGMTALGSKGWASAVEDEEAEQGAPLAVCSPSCWTLEFRAFRRCLQHLARGDLSAHSA